MSLQQRIGIVDDDKKLVALIQKFFLQNGLSDTVALTPEQALECRNPECDLFILDVMMPDIDGFTLCRELKARFPTTLIMFLSARADVFDRVVGLELGADDYLTKPFEPRELLARVNALFRRRDALANRVTAQEGTIDLGEIVFDLDRQCILRDGKAISLTTYEFSLLRLLARNAGIILTRERIIALLERDEFFSCDRSVDIGVSRLRKKIEADPKQPKLLLTVWGRGYQLVAQRGGRS